jgi:DNA topoisomerase-1
MTTAEVAVSSDTGADTAAAISELYADAQRCAESAGLVYVESDAPGVTRVRRGKGFGYRDANGNTVTDAKTRERIAALAIPPAWRNVWICPDATGHLLATGEDAKGRKQYLYHPKWRELRDLLNSYRLVVVAAELPRVRKHVRAQLRRRTLDRDKALAVMLHVVDLTGMRIGSEVYAEENDSVGATTLARRHVQVQGSRTTFDFPAKSGRRVTVTVDDGHVASVVAQLAEQRKRRLFTIDGDPITAAEVNALLAQLTDDRMTAKDFRTWAGTRAAFTYLRTHRDADRESAIIAAIDAAAEVLHNTRAVAREHYVHPHVLETFTAGTFDDYLGEARRVRTPLLHAEERRLAGFLEVLLAAEYGRAR